LEIASQRSEIDKNVFLNFTLFIACNQLTLQLYSKRKEHMERVLTADMQEMWNKCHFISAILDGKLDLLSSNRRNSTTTTTSKSTRKSRQNRQNSNTDSSSGPSSGVISGGRSESDLVSKMREMSFSSSNVSTSLCALLKFALFIVYSTQLCTTSLSHIR
jgi:hypothetical protein